MKNPLADKYRDRMTEGLRTVELRTLVAGQIFSFPDDPYVPYGLVGYIEKKARVVRYLTLDQRLVSAEIEVFLWTYDEYFGGLEGCMHVHSPKAQKPEPVVVKYEDLEPGNVFRFPGAIFPGGREPRIKTRDGHFWWTDSSRWLEDRTTAHKKVTLMEPIPEDE